MKIPACIILVIVLPGFRQAQTFGQDVSASRLQAVLDLPLDQAVKEREEYKLPLRAAYKRQVALTDKDCLSESKQGQQPFNICMGRAAQQADKDFTIFYSNLQMLCHEQAQLDGLQAFQKEWQVYRDSGLKATHASWPDGTGAPGFAGEVYLALLRNHMRVLYEIYGLNIAQ